MYTVSEVCEIIFVLHQAPSYSLRLKMLNCACAHLLLPAHLCKGRRGSTFMHMHVLFFY
jgi:hypothetical protein